MPLTDLQREILAIERGTYRFSGQKERVVRERCHLPMAQYYLALSALLDEPEAERTAPEVVHRLRALRADTRSV